LAAHLSLALFLLAYLFWILLEEGIKAGKQANAQLVLSRNAKRALSAVTGLLVVQIIYGAFVAGLKAGYAYPTFPKMHEHWLPPEAFQMGSIWLDLVETPAMVQFAHRTMGWALLLSVIGLRFWAGREKNETLARALDWSLALVVAQFTLGVATVLGSVPIAVAVSHQVCACFLLLSVVRVNFLARAQV
jgi:cytochrome c oxidase assembly protein subunit 15